MKNPEHCGIPGCGQAVAATLDGEALCRTHFISVCYTRLDEYDELRREPTPGIANTELMRRFIHECTRSADEIEHTGQNLDNLDRAKLVHIILTANELGRQLRRSPRKVASIPVKLISERMGGSWEEETETLLVSRYGALIRCKNSAKPGETIHVLRTDTGDKALARVAWQLLSAKDDPRIGVEFVGCRKLLGE